MARFRVRSVVKGAGGRPIVRERLYDAAKLMIGRHPGSEVHLPDLGIALYHAAMTALPDGRVAFDSPVVTIDPGEGGAVRFGEHEVRLSLGEDGEIVVDVASVAPPPPPPRDERRLFTLADVAPGKRLTAWLLALAVLGLFVAWPVWSFLTPASAHGASADATWSPGPLSAAHAGLTSNCRACHVKAFTAVTDTTCRSCHAGVHDHADPRRLAAARAELPWAARLRQAVATGLGRTPGRCVDCHGEHQGATQLTATPQRFCSDCHATLRSRLSDTRLADAADFGLAHPQFRPAVLLDPGTRQFARASLDAYPREATGLTFSHALHVSGSGAVAQMARRQGQGAALDCADCHVADSDGSFRPVSMAANCQSCHSLAFAQGDGGVRTLRHGDPAAVVAELRDFYATHGRRVAPVGMLGGRRRPGEVTATTLAPTNGTQAIRAVFQPGGACYDCHAVIAPRDGGLNFRIAPVALPQRYLLKGWFDHRTHRSETCASCHAAAASGDARDLILPGIAECRTCHAGEHPAAGQVRSTCATCHSYHQQPVATAPDPRRRGIVAATGMPQLIRRGP